MTLRAAALLSLMFTACGTPTEETPTPPTQVAQPAQPQQHTAPMPGNTAPSTVPGTVEPSTVPGTTTSSVDVPVVGDFLATELVGTVRPVRAVIAKDVIERSPIEEGSEFSIGQSERLYAFIELANPSRTPSKIKMYWLRPNGSRHGEVTLDVGTQVSWRTWAYTRQARTPGLWTAVFETEDGQLLAKKTFTMTQ